MRKIKEDSRQKFLLLVLEWSIGFHPAGSIWVILLALRGFSLVEIGVIEGVFHMVSLCCELPSGVVADVLGRRRSLAASCAMFLLSALLMACSGGLAGVCFAMAVNAVAYNLMSGAREAITYESLLQMGQEGEYLRFSSWQNTVYRLSDGGGMLLAGATLMLGWRLAYVLDAGISLLGLAAVLLLWEPDGERGRKKLTRRQIADSTAATVRGAWKAVSGDRTVVWIMLLNALVGACATLTRFFLQQRVEAAVTEPALLGPALFVLGLGGGLATLFTGTLDRLNYGKAVALTGAGVALCVLLAREGTLPVLLIAGLAAGLLDDALQLVSDKRLNERFPSEQRATLVSLASLTFSLVMIPLSPLFGWLFS